MNRRQIRLERIKAILHTQEIGSQVELARVLAKEGIRLTQPMLSRDMKLLKVVKGLSADGKSIYMLPDTPFYRRVREHREEVNTLQRGIMAVSFSGRLAVVKCRPGYASALASDIDGAGFDEVVGTIAGDDTVFLALADGADQEILDAKLKTVIHK